ncbi:MAG: hypothetical protein CMA64_06530 [Euryarchaeota archaeon]|nr:hypothetical protein [Euryarchaeota archaeon]
MDKRDRAERLAQILLDEVKTRIELGENLSKDPFSDAIIRQIGNLRILPKGHSGRAGSSWQKEANRRLSVGAKKMLEECSTMKEFHKRTHNEHQLPVSATHKWMIENIDRIGYMGLLNKIYSYPMTTITWEEEKRLSKLGDPENRYKEAGIDIVKIAITPKEYYNEARSKNKINTKDKARKE